MYHIIWWGPIFQKTKQYPRHPNTYLQIFGVLGMFLGGGSKYIPNLSFGVWMSSGQFFGFRCSWSFFCFFWLWQFWSGISSCDRFLQAWQPLRSYSTIPQNLDGSVQTVPSLKLTAKNTSTLMLGRLWYLIFGGISHGISGARAFFVSSRL